MQQAATPKTEMVKGQGGTQLHLHGGQHGSNPVRAQRAAHSKQNLFSGAGGYREEVAGIVGGHGQLEQPRAGLVEGVVRGQVLPAAGDDGAADRPKQAFHLRGRRVVGYGHRTSSDGLRTCKNAWYTVRHCTTRPCTPASSA